jgi:hypothetical protein
MACGSSENVPDAATFVNGPPSRCDHGVLRPSQRDVVATLAVVDRRLGVVVADRYLRRGSA